MRHHTDVSVVHTATAHGGASSHEGASSWAEENVEAKVHKASHEGEVGRRLIRLGSRKPDVPAAKGLPRRSPRHTSDSRRPLGRSLAMSGGRTTCLFAPRRGERVDEFAAINKGGPALLLWNPSAWYRTTRGTKATGGVA